MWARNYLQYCPWEQGAASHPRDLVQEARLAWDLGGPLPPPKRPRQ